MERTSCQEPARTRVRLGEQRSLQQLSRPERSSSNRPFHNYTTEDIIISLPDQDIRAGRVFKSEEPRQSFVLFGGG